MTDGTSQGLFIVVAIVIFGIFTLMAYILFEDTLSPALANMFTEASEKAQGDLTFSKNYSLNGNFSKVTENPYDWDTSLNGKYRGPETNNQGWKSGVNKGVGNYQQGYHSHVNVDKFGQHVLAFVNRNNEIADVDNNRWLGISHAWLPDSNFMQTLDFESKIVVSFDMYSDKVGGYVYGGVFQESFEAEYGTSQVPGIDTVQVTATKKDTWENVSITIPMNENIRKNENLYIYIYGHGNDNHATKYIDNIKVRIEK